MLAYVLEILNPVVRSSAQLQRELGITAAVSVPVYKPKKPRKPKKPAKAQSKTPAKPAPPSVIWAGLKILGRWMKGRFVKVLTKLRPKRAPRKKIKVSI